METLIETFGFFSDVPVWASVGSAILLALVFAYTSSPLWLWAIAGYAGLWGLEAPVWIFAVYTLMILLAVRS